LTSFLIRNVFWFIKVTHLNPTKTIQKNKCFFGVQRKVNTFLGHKKFLISLCFRNCLTISKTFINEPYLKQLDEKKFKTLEKERSNALEVATEEDEKGQT
jgi:hypothetical protein